MGDKNITLEEMRSRNAKALRALQGEPELVVVPTYEVTAGWVTRKVLLEARELYVAISNFLADGYTLEQISIEVAE